MELKHLSYEEIQDYLDSSPSSVNKTIEEHLETCQLCKGVLEKYKKLYTELKKDTGFELSPDFANSVISKLPQKVKSRPLASYAGIFLAVLGLSLGIGSLLYLAGWKYINQVLANIVQPQLNYISTLWGIMGRLLTGLNLDFGLLLISGLILLIISMLDRMLTHKKHKPISFYC
jgi:hypothetical protein